MSKTADAFMEDVYRVVDTIESNDRETVDTIMGIKVEVNHNLGEDRGHFKMVSSSGYTNTVVIPDGTGRHTIYDIVSESLFAFEDLVYDLIGDSNRAYA